MVIISTSSKFSSRFYQLSPKAISQVARSHLLSLCINYLNDNMTAVDCGKLSPKHVENAVGDGKNTVPMGDYSGAVAKTDASEIALVRKLDLRIMPTLFVMYFL